MRKIVRMLENDDIEITYNDFPYLSMTVPDTHPDSMASIARFHGLESTSPLKCRVLELGCGNGSNLNWMASVLPDSEFIGIDLSKYHIDQAREALAKLGTNNASFHKRDLLELDEKSFGKFDYIVAHGLFSWVPEVVSEKLLDLYGKLLVPNGVGYISYNALPGFYLRQLMRDSMQFHVRGISKPSEFVIKARTFAQFLSENAIGAPLYNELLKSEFDEMIDREDSNICHDDLSAFNNPFYFSDFIGRSEKYGLQFLAESGRPTFLPPDLPPQVLEFIENNSKNVIESEQYIDLFGCTKFRKTLLCRSEVSLNREFNSNAIRQFYISSALRPDLIGKKAANQETEKYTTNSGSSFETDHLLTKAVLTSFDSNESHEVSFEELVIGSRDDLIQNGFNCDDWDKEIKTTVSILLQLYIGDLIRFHVSKSAALNYIPEKPRVSDFARLQAAKGGRVPTNQGVNIELSDDFTRELFALLKGDMTRDELIGALVAKLFTGKDKNSEREEFTEKISEALDGSLKQMVRVGFLV